MSMGRRRPKQPDIWLPYNQVARSPGHRFYEKLNELLEEENFDRKVEELCAPFYAAPGTGGRPSIPPGVYFRMLLIGYFEGIESERGIAWRCADSLSLREFLGYQLGERTPDHSTLTRIRQRLAPEVYEEVFRLVLAVVKKSGLLRGEVLGVDSTYLRADASMKNIVRRDNDETYQEYLKRLAQEAGIEEPTAEDCRRMDKKRKGKKTSNKEWVSKTDPDARIARIKDGRTRLAYKPEHAVDLETGAILAVDIHAADAADSATILVTAEKARENLANLPKDFADDAPSPTGNSPDADSAPRTDDTELPDTIELVADKGYNKAQTLLDLKMSNFRTYIPERRQKGDRRWADNGGPLVRQAFHENRARTKRKKGRQYQRLRGEYLERTFAHVCETGAGRRTRLRGLRNVKKQYLIRTAAANLGLVMRKLHRFGTPREAAARAAALIRAILALLALLKHDSRTDRQLTPTLEDCYPAAILAAA